MNTKQTSASNWLQHPIGEIDGWDYAKEKRSGLIPKKVAIGKNDRNIQTHTQSKIGQGYEKTSLKKVKKSI